MGESMTSAVKIMPPAKCASAPTGMPRMPWLPITTWFGSAVRSASRSVSSARWTGSTLQRSSPRMVRCSGDTATLTMPPAGRPARSRRPASFSSYRATPARAARKESSVSPTSTITESGRTSTSAPTSVDGEGHVAARRTPARAGPVAPGDPPPRCACSRTLLCSTLRWRSWARPVTHRSTLDVDVRGVDFVRRR